jgi:hypothetical protein
MAHFDGPLEFDFEAELQRLLDDERPVMGLPGVQNQDPVDNNYYWLDMCLPSDTRPLPANSDSCRQSDQMEHNIPELKVLYAPLPHYYLVEAKLSLEWEA